MNELYIQNALALYIVGLCPLVSLVISVATGLYLRWRSR